jgi:hypothetical protein
MQFITIVEKNYKENETFVHYCQWDGNEEELGKLLKVLDFALYDDMDGDYSMLWHEEGFISESAVDQHVRLRYGCFDHMFQKHTGVFTCPEFDYIRDEYEAAKMIDDFFYASKIKRYFEKPATQT